MQEWKNTMEYNIQNLYTLKSRENIANSLVKFLSQESFWT